MGNATTNMLTRIRNSTGDFDEAIEAVFRKADKNCNGVLDTEEFDTLVDELGKYLTDLVNAQDVRWQVKDMSKSFIDLTVTTEKREKAALFKSIDNNHDGGISIEELKGYVYHLIEAGPTPSPSSPRKKPQSAAMDSMDDELFAQASPGKGPGGRPPQDLETVFKKFCAFGAGKGGEPEMDNAKFAKFCRDTKVLDKRFTATDADLIFSKAKAKTERKISYKTFSERAIPLVAEKKGITVDALVAKICGGGGPSSSGTKADAVKFHDDKSLYTGVYAKGGPTNVDKDKISLAGLVSDHNALSCDVRGVVHR